MVTKTKKQQVVAELTEQINNADSFYFIDYSFMPVKLQEAMRNELKEKQASMRVAKNTLIKRAFDAADGVELPFEKLTGMTNLIMGTGEELLAPAKILKEFAQKNKMPAFKGALLDGQYFDEKQLDTLAAMPTKPEIIAGILGSINAPISGIVGAINATIRDLASVIEEVAKKNAN